MDGKLVSKILLLLSPFIRWVDKTFTRKYSVKKISGAHYYLWRDEIKKGQVLLTNTLGAGSNLINPSDINHGSMYFGFGLREEILTQLTKINDTKEVLRITEVLNKYDVRDDVAYVIEAIGQGVVPTDLVTFLTTKDLVKCVKPNFCNSDKMGDAANKMVSYLGIPYDFAFSKHNDKKYCFEACANAYEETGDKILKRAEYKLFGFKVFDTFLSDTFLTNDWDLILDSKTTRFKYKH